MMKADVGGMMIKWRRHMQFEINRYFPKTIELPPYGGNYDERAVFEKSVVPDRLSVMDRGFTRSIRFNALHPAERS